jgi:response regulator of citrate/malate metabolism
MQNGAVTTVATRHDPPKEEFPDNLEEATRLHVRRVFEKCDRNLTRAAAALGISRNTARKYL